VYIILLRVFSDCLLKANIKLGRKLIFDHETIPSQLTQFIMGYYQEFGGILILLSQIGLFRGMIKCKYFDSCNYLFGNIKIFFDKKLDILKNNSKKSILF
jgi:hypothetical protein